MIKKTKCSKGALVVFFYVEQFFIGLQGRSKGGGQVGPAHPRIKVKHIKNKIHLQYLSIICLWFKIWPTPAKNHCYALDRLSG
jgi:hypothetical protein